MKKTILIGLLITLSLISCVSKRKTSVLTNTQVLSDTLIRHHSEAIVLPQRNVIVLESPCKENVLAIANQKITNEKSSINIKSDNGNLVVSVDIDSIVNSRLAETSIGSNVERVEIPVEVEVPVRNPFNWYAIIYGICTTGFILRKPIFSLVRRLVIPI